MEYKVEKCKVNHAEKMMNEWAKKGWQVIGIVPNGYGPGSTWTITFEKK